MTQAANLGALGTTSTSTGGLTGTNLGTPTALVLTNATGLPKAALPAGSVLQVVQSTYTTVSSGNNNTGNGLNDFGDSGLTVSITPTSATSKILVFGTLAACIQQYTYERVVNRLLRNSTVILAGAAAGNRPQTISATTRSSSYGIDNISFSYLDSPATTSSTTYKMQIAAAGGGTLTWLVNASGSDGDNNAFSPRGISIITAMEIAA